MTEKRTKREIFAELRACVIDKENLVKFIDHEVELLEKKNVTKSKAQIVAEAENVKLANDMVAFMSKDTPRLTFTATAIAKGIDVTTQKATALLIKEVEPNGRLIKTSLKGVSLYSVKPE